MNYRTSTRSAHPKARPVGEAPQPRITCKAQKESVRMCGGAKAAAKQRAASSQWVLLRGGGNGGQDGGASIGLHSCRPTQNGQQAIREHRPGEREGVLQLQENVAGVAQFRCQVGPLLGANAAVVAAH